jgi:hypothetical protein
MHQQPAAIAQDDASTRPAPDAISDEAGQCRLIHSLLLELRADIQAFRDEIHGDLISLRADMRRWNEEAAHAG